MTLEKLTFQDLTPYFFRLALTKQRKKQPNRYGVPHILHICAYLVPIFGGVPILGAYLSHIYHPNPEVRGASPRHLEGHVGYPFI
jgi:hypothetical protein